MKELKTISDEKLLRQIQSGNDDAMECLLERYRDMVRKEARSFFLAGCTGEYGRSDPGRNDRAF